MVFKSFTNQFNSKSNGILFNCRWKPHLLKAFQYINLISKIMSRGVTVICLYILLYYKLAYSITPNNPEDIEPIDFSRTTTPTPFPSPTPSATPTPSPTPIATPTPCQSLQCHENLTQLGTCQCCPDSSWVWNTSTGECVRDCTNVVKIMHFYYSNINTTSPNFYSHEANIPQFISQVSDSWFNWGGKKEKWILGSGKRWYFILPNGELYLWDNNNDLSTSTLVTTLSVEIYEHPERLTNTVSDQVYNTYLKGLDICGGGYNLSDNGGYWQTTARCLYAYFTGDHSINTEMTNLTVFRNYYGMAYTGANPYGKASIVYDRCPDTWIYRGGYDLEYLHYLRTGRVAMCRYAVIYLDQFGRAISAPLPGKEICEAGLLQFGLLSAGSPISLLWNGQTGLDTEVESINFAIDNSGKKKRILWRASGTQPLLVYDPDHTGQISDATQLFGNWTFGGKLDPIVNTSVESNSTQKRKAWDDGFEALATLDADANGKVDRTELDPLGIWFDYNKNGISEPGEVLSAYEAKVIALYYKVDHRDSRTKDAYANHGFDRIEKGRLISGTSVDWYTPVDKSVDKLISKHLEQSLTCAENKEENKKEVSLSVEQNKITSSSIDLTANTPNNNRSTSSKPAWRIAGPWKWSKIDFSETNPFENKNPHGFLMFVVNDKGQISGHSYSQIYLEHAGEADSMIGISQLFGKIDETKNEQTKFTFEIVTPNGGTVQSSAELIENGTKIKGETVATVPYEKMTINTRYHWVAERLP